MLCAGPISKCCERSTLHPHPANELDSEASGPLSTTWVASSIIIAPKTRKNDNPAGLAQIVTKTSIRIFKSW